MIEELQVLVSKHGFNDVLNTLISLHSLHRQDQDDEISVETITIIARAIAVETNGPGSVPTRLNYCQAAKVSTAWDIAKCLDWVHGNIQL